jgi:ADP-ribose pyrophosphatase YjhB (NUDIX family)
MSAYIPRFCSQCGGSLADRFVEAENRLRGVCAQCGEIAYRGPQVLVSTIVMSGDRVLMCRRASPPQAGRWVLPGGFVEFGETLEQAAVRETREETGVCLDPRDLHPYAVATLPEISEVYAGFLAVVPESAEAVCGDECTDVRFFSEDDVPWSELAYPDTGVYLREYLSERRRGVHMVHFGCIESTCVASKAYRIAEVEEARRPRAE